jgi:transposase-like protein
MTMAELSKKYGVHPTQIGTWKRAAIRNTASAFSKQDGDPGRVAEAQIDKLGFIPTKVPNAT